MSKFYILFFAFLLMVGSVVPAAASASEVTRERRVALETLVGEQLVYDVSFLWFDRLAEGTIRLSRGEIPGTYLAELKARTRGFAAFVTNNRVEKLQTLMEFGPDGLLRPLRHSTHSLKGEGKDLREKETSYAFDYQASRVKYQKIKDHVINADELIELQGDTSVYDVLSAFYNLRIGAFGPLSKEGVSLATLHRTKVEEIAVLPATPESSKDKRFFASDALLCEVLVDPEIFKTNGRTLLVSFDEHFQPQKAVVKNVIGLGDVKGVLRQVVTPLQAMN